MRRERGLCLEPVSPPAARCLPASLGSFLPEHGLFFHFFNHECSPNLLPIPTAAEPVLLFVLGGAAAA